MAILNTISRIEPGENTPERLLWRAVIARTIQEWLSGSQRRHLEAEEYLFTDSRQLSLVCEMAAIDIGQLRLRLTHFHGRALPNYALAA
jgi:hypothetical protein